MAITRVRGSSNHQLAGGSTLAVTLAATVGSGNAVCGICSWDNAGGSTLSSVTDDKGNTYNLESKIVETNNNQSFQAFSLTNITNAPQTVTMNLSGSEVARAIIATEFSGTSTASTNERDGAAHGGQFQSSPGTGTDAVTSGNFTTSTNGDLLFGASGSGTGGGTFATDGTSFTHGTGDQEGGDYSMQTEWREQATAGSGTAATLTQATNNPRVTFLIAIKPQAAAAVYQPYQPHYQRAPLLAQ